MGGVSQLGGGYERKVNPPPLLQSLLNPDRMFSALPFRYRDQIHLKAKAQGCEALDKPFQVQYAPCTDAEQTSGNHQENI